MKPNTTVPIKKQEVVKRIQGDSHYMFSVLKTIYQRQTALEQQAAETIEKNGRGFNLTDARPCTKIAKAAISRGRLAPREIHKLRKPDRRGFPPLAKYWRQIEEVEQQHEAMRAIRKPPTVEGSPRYARRKAS